MCIDDSVKYIIELICDVLLEKNKKYGNSALKPLKVFYKDTATNSILVRLDDKLSRIKHEKELKKNDMFDFLGYLFLLCISENYFGTDSINKFKDKLKVLKDNIEIHYSQQEERKVFSKEFITNKFEAIQIIKRQGTSIYPIMELICSIINYLIDNNITDFSDIIN